MIPGGVGARAFKGQKLQMNLNDKHVPSDMKVKL